jgi:hypothetical protein
MKFNDQGFLVIITDPTTEAAILLSARFSNLTSEGRGHVIARGQRALHDRLVAKGGTNPPLLCPLPLWFAVEDLANERTGQGFRAMHEQLLRRIKPLETLRGSTTPLLSFMAANAFGIITVADQTQTIRTAVQVISSLPDVRTTVVAPTHVAVDDLRGAVRTVGLDQKLQPIGNGWPRLVIGTPVRTDVGIADADLLIFVGVDSIRTKYSWLPYEKASRARRYLITPATTLSSWDRAKARSMFGFSELKLLPSGQPVREFRLAWFDHRAHQANLDRKRTPDLLRNLVWLAAPRNRRIARLARELIGQRPADRSADLVVQAPSTPAERRTVLLVDSVEHAVELTRWIDWPVALAENADIGALPPPLANELAQRPASIYGNERGRIVTVAAANVIDWGKVDVVIRADAGIGLPAIAPHSADGPLLLVDVDDRRNRVLSRLAARRRWAYQRAGWYALGADPEVERLSEFQREITR